MKKDKLMEAFKEFEIQEIHNIKGGNQPYTIIGSWCNGGTYYIDILYGNGMISCDIPWRSE
ncbi:MAG TPA: hypothetical protein VFL70_06295 [Bacteroidia bacterium]|nr:hypothetical protein [Bacteroidia bacterium]